MQNRVCGFLRMLAIGSQMRILAAVQEVDFRKGIESLAESCRAKLRANLISGCMFVFRSRRATSIKIVVYDSVMISSKLFLPLASHRGSPQCRSVGSRAATYCRCQAASINALLL
jgi:hypothetical protein